MGTRSEVFHFKFLWLLTRFEDIEEGKTATTTTTAQMNKTRFHSWLSTLYSRIFIVLLWLRFDFEAGKNI